MHYGMQCRMWEILGEGNQDTEKSYSSYGLFVNAWMPFPEPYKGE